MNRTMTVNVYIRVISSSLTPGFHCPDTRSYRERLERSFGNGSEKVTADGIAQIEYYFEQMGRLCGEIKP